MSNEIPTEVLLENTKGEFLHIIQANCVRFITSGEDYQAGLDILVNYYKQEYKGYFTDHLWICKRIAKELKLKYNGPDLSRSRK